MDEQERKLVGLILNCQPEDLKSISHRADGSLAVVAPNGMKFVFSPVELENARDSFGLPYASTGSADRSTTASTGSAAGDSRGSVGGGSTGSPTGVSKGSAGGGSAGSPSGGSTGSEGRFLAASTGSAGGGSTGSPFGGSTGSAGGVSAGSSTGQRMNRKIRQKEECL